jgi:hypothetical protein
MYIILKTNKGGVEEFAVYNKLSHTVLASYSTYAEAFKDLLSR